MWIPVKKHVTVAAKLGIALSSLNTVVKNKKDIEKCMWCGRKVMRLETGNAVHEPTMLLPPPSRGS